MVEKFFSSNKEIAIAVLLFALSYALIYSLNYLGEFLTGMPFFGGLFPGYNWATGSGTISPMYVLLPALGFLGVYFLIYWAKQELNWSFMESWAFPVVFILFCLIAFYFVLFFFYMPQSQQVASQGGLFYVCPYRVEQNLQDIPGEDRAEKMGNAFSSNPSNCLWNSCLQCDVLKVRENGVLQERLVCQQNYQKCFGSSAFFLFLLGGLAGWVSFRLQKTINKSLL